MKEFLPFQGGAGDNLRRTELTPLGGGTGLMKRGKTPSWVSGLGLASSLAVRHTEAPSPGWSQQAGGRVGLLCQSPGAGVLGCPSLGQRVLHRPTVIPLHLWPLGSPHLSCGSPSKGGVFKTIWTSERGQVVIVSCLGLENLRHPQGHWCLLFNPKDAEGGRSCGQHEKERKNLGGEVEREKRRGG